MTTVLEIVVPVFAIVAVGFLMSGRFQFDTESLATLALWVTAPALIFSSLANMEFRASDWATMIGGTCFVAGVTGFLGWLCTRQRPNQRNATVLVLAFWNAGNLPLPICRLAFGEEGLKFATMVFVCMAILHSTVGIWLANGNSNAKEVLKVPLVYSCVAGVLVSATGLPLPNMVLEPIRLLGDMAIPLMLFSLGIQLRTLGLHDFRHSVGVAFGRIGIGFLAGLAFVTLVPMNDVARKVLLLNSMMPPAVINFVLASRYRIEPTIVASAIVFSTILAVVAIPLVLWFLGPQPLF